MCFTGLFLLFNSLFKKIKNKYSFPQLLYEIERNTLTFLGVGCFLVFVSLGNTLMRYICFTSPQCCPNRLRRSHEHSSALADIGGICICISVKKNSMLTCATCPSEHMSALLWHPTVCFSRVLFWMISSRPSCVFLLYLHRFMFVSVVHTGQTKQPRVVIPRVIN